MEEIILFFETKIKTPLPWGTYHLCCLGVLALCTVLLFAFGKRLRKNPRTVRRLTAGIGIFLLVIELFKQVLIGLHADENGVYWDYPWYAFPFQLCSTPLYACIALLFCPEGRVRQALCCYLGTFGMIGGIAVMLIPSTVFVDTLFLDLHTMAWHICLVLLGVLQWSGGTIGMRFSDLCGGSIVFLICVCIAVALNLSLPQYAEEGFNMFYLSPYVPISMSDFVEKLWENVPYPVYLIGYVLALLLAAAAIFYAARAIRKAYARGRAEQ